ncbi:MAG TPA: regulatory protein RecX [Solirubrobacteraceae bacterium]|nr:regulatory protein RecX [Solirubrobacteraceae bacterium]
MSDQRHPPAADPAVSDQPATPEARLQKGLALSYAYINRRERTAAELSAHLERKGIETGVAAECLRELTGLGYVDDRRYALMFVHDKRELEGWGSERIRRGLAERGVDRAAIEAALAEHETEFAAGETELDRAVALLARRFPEPPRERRDRDRALGALIRKGFDSELALDALTAYARGG